MADDACSPRDHVTGSPKILTRAYTACPARTTTIQHEFPRFSFQPWNTAHTSLKALTSTLPQQYDIVSVKSITKKLTMENPNGDTKTPSKRRTPPPRPSRGVFKKKREEEKKDDSAVGTNDETVEKTTNDGSPTKTPRSKTTSTETRGPQYVEDRKDPIRAVGGLLSHAHLASTRVPHCPKEYVATKPREKQEDTLLDLEASYRVTDNNVQKYPVLEPVRRTNVDRVFIRPYNDWRDDQPWCLKAFGNGIERLDPTETSFETIDTARRVGPHIKYNMEKPQDRNCCSCLSEKCRMRDCACQKAQQNGMKVYHNDRFSTDERGAVTFDLDDSDQFTGPITEDVFDYFRPQMQFLLACTTLLDPTPPFTDRQIYRFLRQHAFVVQTFDKWAIVFRADITKKGALPFMTRICCFHLLEPLGILKNMSGWVQLSGKEVDENPTQYKKRVNDERKRVRSAAAHLNAEIGIRAFAAFFAYQQSDGNDYPGEPVRPGQKRKDVRKLHITSCEYKPLKELGWVNAGVDGRLQILADDDSHEDTVAGGLCHRIDFHHRLTRICLGGMVLQSNILTKIQYNLVGPFDTPPLEDVYVNFQLLYGPAVDLVSFTNTYNQMLGCLVSAETVEEHQIVPVSGYLVYSHSKAVTDGHGFRHSVDIDPKYYAERLEGTTEKIKDEKDAKRRKRYSDTIETYHASLQDRPQLSNIRDLYQLKVTLSAWDDEVDDFEAVTDEKDKDKVVAIRHNRVKHTVIALRGLPLYCFDNNDFGVYDSDYCVFTIPDALQGLLPRVHHNLLSKNGYTIKDMITAGMRRINANDNLFSFPTFETCEELFARFGDNVSPREMQDAIDSLKTAIQKGCEVALQRKHDGSVTDRNCSIRMRLQCNVPDLTKTTMECKRTAYPLSAIREASQKGVVVLSGIIPLHDSGFLQQAYKGVMKTSQINPGTRFTNVNGKVDKIGLASFRGLPVFLSPDSFVLYPASLPVACGMPVTPGISYFIELDVQLSIGDISISLPMDTLGGRCGLDCYLTSGGPAMSFFPDDASVVALKETMDKANSCMEETSFHITKGVVLPSVVYWSQHGQESQLGKILFDQIDSTMELLGRGIWFGNSEHLTDLDSKNLPRMGKFAHSQQQQDQPTQLPIEETQQLQVEQETLMEEEEETLIPQNATPE